VFFVVEDMPEYPGGQIELALLVQKMENKLVKEKKLKGAYAIVKEMEDWKPGKQRGKAVPVKYLLPVEFE
jgi:hypothetical protein